MKTLLGALALILVASPLRAQDVKLAPGESLTVRAMDSVTVIIDSVLVVDTVPVFECPSEWTCTPPPIDPPQMVVEADSAGLAVSWAAQPADSFWVYGARDDTGADEWDVILPGTATTYHRPLSYMQATPMLTCVVAIRFDELGQSCETVTWSPPAPPPDELPGAPGRPEFIALEDGRVRVTWPEAARATSYTYWYSGHAESEGLTTPTNSVVLDDFENGGFFCTRGKNELGPAPAGEYRCNSYRPDPDPPPDPPPPEAGIYLELWERIGHEGDAALPPEEWVYNRFPGTTPDGDGSDALPINVHPGHGYRFKVVGADSAEIRVEGATFRGPGLVPPWPDQPDWTVPAQDSIHIEWTAWPGPVGGREAFEVRCFGGPPWTFEERGASC